MKKVVSIVLFTLLIGQIHAGSEAYNGCTFTTSSSNWKIILPIVGLIVALPAIKQVQNNLYMSKNTIIGVIDIEGTINDSSIYLNKLENFAKNPFIKAIILRINSLGGNAGTSEIISREIEIIKRIKPIVAMVENVCASAAYQIASACDSIIAPAGATIGSIGTVLSLGKYEESPVTIDYGNIGVAIGGKFRPEYIKSGKFKVAGSPYLELSEEERAYFQKYVDDGYKTFCEYVAVKRGLDLSKLSEWADAKIFTGKQALDIQLIDKIGALTETKRTIIDLIQSRGGVVKGEIYLLDNKPNQFWSLSSPKESMNSFVDFISNIFIKTTKTTNQLTSFI